MKDGRTHLAHKAEHAVDLDTGAIVAVTLQAADQGDTTTLDETLCEAGEQVAEQIRREAESRPQDKPKVHLQGIEELVHHSLLEWNDCVLGYRDRLRTYLAAARGDIAITDVVLLS